MEDLSDEELRAKTDELRVRVREKKEDLNGALLEEAFAVSNQTASTRGWGSTGGGLMRRRRAVVLAGVGG